MDSTVWRNEGASARPRARRCSARTALGVVSAGDRRSRSRRHRVRSRLLAAIVLGTAAVLTAHRLAYAHAKLLSSEPAAGSVLTANPARIRLVFSERVEATLSSIALVDSAGHQMRLNVRLDPQNTHALIAAVMPLAPGAYRVSWRAVSADGHPVSGSYAFTMGQARAAETLPAAPPTAAPVPSHEIGPSIAGAPVLLSLARGLGIGALMGAAGLSLFLFWNDARARRPRQLARWFAVAAFVLLVIHLLLWLAHTSPSGHLDSAWSREALGTGTGARELWRVGLTLLALCAMALPRRPLIAFVCAGAALVVSGSIGHPAGIAPYATIPAKALHLFAGALWLGGLLWLAVRERDDAMRYRAEALRVSAVSLWAVVVVALSGIVQTVFFLLSPLDLVRSAYGRIVLLKLLGLLVLMGFGAFHRYRVLPRLHASSDARRLGRSVRRESVVLLLVVLLGGWLANVSPPQDLGNAPVPAARSSSR